MRPDQQNPAGSDLAGHIILIIDDDHNSLDIVSGYLEECHFSVLIAEDGESGLKRAEYARPDLILLDIMMPGLDGYETCRRLKEMESTKDIPVIFMTALADAKHKVRGFEAGAVDYVVKPVQREEVVARVGVHLRIRELAAGLRKANESLEQHIRERTAELRDNNEKLAIELAERKRAEEALRNSGDLLHAVIEAAPIAIIGLDLDGQVQSVWNPAAEKMLGWTAEEVMGHPLPTVPRDHQEEFAHFREMIRQGMTLNGVEACRQRRDGTPIHYSIYASPLHDTEGRIAGNIAVLVDITERQRADEILAERIMLAELTTDIGASLARQRDLQTMLKECAEALVRHLDAAFARIWTFNPDENLLELKASAGMYTHIDGAHSRVPLGKYKIGLIADERRPHVTNSVIGDPRVHDQEWAIREGMVSFAGHPLMLADKVVGVMALFFRKPLTDVTLKALAFVADGIAVGIERNTAEQELKKLNEELEHRVRERTKELEQRYFEMERLNKVFVGRELRMTELKKRIKSLEAELRGHDEASPEKPA